MKKHLLLIFVLAMLFGFGVRAQSTCNAPTGLTASAHNPMWENVLLNWNTIVDDTQADLMWSTSTLYTRIGTNGGADFVGVVRFTPTELADYAGRYLSSITFVPGTALDISHTTYSIMVWQGGSITNDTVYDPGTVIVNQAITNPLTPTVLNTILLDTAPLIDNTQELWIGIRCIYDTTCHPLGASNNGGVINKGALFYMEEEWDDLAQTSNLADYNWIIIGHLQEYSNILSGYNLYRDDVLLASIGATSYIDTLEEGTYQYALTASYANGCESDPVTASVTMTSYPCDNCLDTLIVGNGTSTTYYIPLNTFYNYSFSEQIYTADELSDITGKINCISFQYIHSSDQSKDIVVYMGNTAKSSFSNGSDWIPVSQMAPVFQGSVNFTNIGEDNWVNIPFDVPFEYDGSSNIVVAVLNNTGSYVSSSSPTFNMHSASGKTLYEQNDSSPYDVDNLGSGSTYSNRNNIRFLIGEPISCPMPGQLTITNITAEGATASWTSNEAHNGYELVLVPDGESMEDQNPITVGDTFYVFDNLSDNTTYSVYLRAICSGDNSSWVYPATFTTDPYCTSPENLTISQVAGASALVSWEPAAVGAISYTVAYTEAGQENWVTQPVSDFQYMLSGLTPMTTYEVAVTSVCEMGNAPAIVKTFTTHCLAGGELAIGDGTTTTSYIPSYSTYNYSYTQQIFTAAEIGGPTNITSVAMNMSSLSQQRRFKIYLAHTSDTSLATGWASTTGAQLVFDSPQTLTTGWNTFDFTTSFAYNGTDNLLLIVVDSTGSWVSGNSWYAHSATGLARYIYQDSSPYSVNPPSGSGTVLGYRNNVLFGGNCDETITCIAPNAYLSNITSESITVTWVPGNTETSWELEYSSDTANWISEGQITTSPYTITNLDANTFYYIRMRSICGGGEYSNYKYMQGRTECDVIANLPYTEDFDSYSTGSNAYPTCWSKLNTYASSNVPYITTTHYSGVGSLYFYAGTSGSYNIAVMPPISSDINANTLSATFMYRANSSNDILVVGVMTDPAHANTFVAVDTIYPDLNATEWVERTAYFNNYTGDGQYIAFKNEYITSYSYAYIDDLVLEVMSDCPKPTLVTATSTQSDTVFLAWQDDFGSVWNIAYGPVGFDPTNSTDATLIQGVTDNPYPISGLEAGIGYDFYVQSDCGDEVSNWNTFPATAYAYTYTMGITGYDSVAGCGFTITDNGGAGGNYANNCDYTLVVYPSDPDSIVSLSGTFVGEGTVDYLSVYNGVGIDESELIQKITSGSSGTVINFGPLTSDAGPLTLHFHTDGSVVYAGFVANVTCLARPSCPRPTHLAVSASSSTSVTLQWVASGNETTWNIEYGPTGFTQGSGDGTVVAANTNPFTVDNLTTGTTYDFYVQADCGGGDESPWIGPVTATPGSYNMPTSGNHTISACDLVIFDDGGLNGNYSNNCDAYLTINPEAPGYVISIQGTSSTESCCDYLRIYDGPDINGTLLGEFKGENQIIPELSSTTGPITLHFHSDVSIQNTGFSLTVSCASNTCPKPTNVHATDATTTSVTLDWTPSGDETSWEIAYGEGTFDPEDATANVVTANAHPFEIQNLNSSTAYKFYVRAICSSDDQSSWTSPITASTACDIISLPYAEDFDSYVGSTYSDNQGIAPACWSTFSTNATYGNPHIVSSGSYHYAASGNSLVFTCGSAGADAYAALPTFDQPLNTLTVNFWRAMESTSSGTLTVGYVTNLADMANTFVEVATIPSVSSTNGDTISVDFTNINIASGNICFHWNYASSYYSCCIDNVNVFSDGSGPVITDPTVATNNATGVSQTTATLNATITNPSNVNITAKGFEWKTTTGGTFTQIAGTGTGNSFTANLTGLTPNTGYTFKAFITYNGQTAYGTEQTFTTLDQGVDPCDVPTGITTSNITKESITVSWNANPDVTTWNIQYRPQNGTLSSATSTTNSYVINDLNPVTTYEIQVQAVCSNGQTSDWSSIVTATTLPDGIVSHLENSVSLYPNPANEVVNVQCTMYNVQVEAVEVIDVYGKVIRTVVGANDYSSLQSTQINVSGLANGMYFVRVTTDQGVVTKPFVKK